MQFIYKPCKRPFVLDSDVDFLVLVVDASVDVLLVLIELEVDVLRLAGKVLVVGVVVVWYSVIEIQSILHLPR